ncbi:MAG: hypothetical protein ACRC3J_07415, partial [Culicoidibacterales bacterium]
HQYTLSDTNEAHPDSQNQRQLAFQVRQCESKLHQSCLFSISQWLRITRMNQQFHLLYGKL